ncbi:MAG: radical SAM protein [Deltaproteobacteria bacterium]|nr:radical SAM protein [Deltaproteobacteria bacterium]
MRHGLPVDLISVNVELTLACNLRCVHCGSTAGRPRPAELTTAEFLRLVRDFRAIGCREMCLLGGEPLLRRDWFEICEAVCAAEMDLVLITNGMLVTPALVERLRRLPRLDRIGVSLDAATPEVHDRIRGRQGSFDAAWRTIRLLVEAGFEVGAITTVSKWNLGELPGLRDLLLGRNVTWQLQTATPQGGRFDRTLALTPREYYRVGRFISECRRRHTVDELPVAGAHGVGYCSSVLGPVGELPDWHGCAGGLATLGITSDGGVKPCLSQPDDRLVGNIRTRPLAEIWADDSLFRRTRRFRLDMLRGFCRDCEHARTCRAGCPNVAIAASGSDGDNPFCFHRIEVEEAARRRGRSARRPPVAADSARPPGLTATLLHRSGPDFERLREELADKYGRTVDSFGDRDTLFVGVRERGRLCGFGIFEDEKNLRRHVGNPLDLELARELLERRDIALYRVSLLHGFEGPERLAEIAAAAVEGADAALARRHPNRCLLMSHLIRGNAMARPLYRRLGFVPQRRRTTLYEFDLRPFATGGPGPVPLPADLAVRFLDETAPVPVEKLAACYSRVFLHRGAVSGRSFAAILAADDFAPELSMVVTEVASGDVVGFLLAERPEPGAVLVAAAGLDRRWRRHGLSLHCFPLFCERAVREGRPTGRFVTGRRRVAHLTQGYLGAVRVDSLGWLLRCRSDETAAGRRRTATAAQKAR